MKPGLIRRDTDVNKAMWRSMSAGARMAMIGLGLLDPADIPTSFRESEGRDVRDVERAVDGGR